MIYLKGKKYTQVLFFSSMLVLLSSLILCIFYRIILYKVVGIKIARRNINNLRYADDITLMAESEEELKSLLMKVKEEIEKSAENSTFKKLRSWHLVPSLHGK